METNQLTLVERAYFISDAFAFEAIDSESMGRRIIQVTDCRDERNRATFLVNGSEFLEKTSIFMNEIRYHQLLLLMDANAEFLLDGYYGD